MSWDEVVLGELASLYMNITGKVVTTLIHVKQ